MCQKHKQELSMKLAQKQEELEELHSEMDKLRKEIDILQEEWKLANMKSIKECNKKVVER